MLSVWRITLVTSIYQCIVFFSDIFDLSFLSTICSSKRSHKRWLPLSQPWNLNSKVSQCLSCFLFFYLSLFKFYFIYWIMKMKVEGFYWILLDTKAHDWITSCPLSVKAHGEEKRLGFKQTIKIHYSSPFPFQSSDFYEANKNCHGLFCKP